MKTMKLTISPYSTKSVPRPMPSTRATRVSSSGKKMENAATQANRTSIMRRMARCLAFEPPRISAKDTTMTASTRATWTMICTISPKEEVSDDIDRVQQRLALGFRVVRIDDLHGVFNPARIHLRQLMDKFGGVSHAVLLQVDAVGNCRAEGTEAVVCIGQRHSGRKPRLHGGSPQHQPLQRRQLCAVIKE